MLRVGARVALLLLAATGGTACQRTYLDLSRDMPALDEFGTGLDGPLMVSSTGTLINECFRISRVDAGEVVVEGWTPQPAGRRLLLLQVQDAFAVSGAQAPLLGAATDAGRSQIVTVRDATADGAETRLEIEPPAAIAYAGTPGRPAEACTIPEYSDVTVNAGASLAAASWDGERGGLLAFYVSGTLLLSGGLTADGAGFRGGTARPDSGTNSIETLDTDDASGLGGGKGEGLDSRSWSRSGRGNYANGGGGGNAHNAGGGGGGNGGAGGSGGKQEDSSGTTPLTEGLPGVAVLPTSGRLVMGGGGGAGQQNNGVVGTGGAGGGLVVVAASTLAGAGYASADGLDGEDCGAAAGSGFPDGAGGGGAGGEVRIRAAATSFTGTLTARGGNGGNTVFLGNDNALGPGGGGGGGRVVTEGWTPRGTNVSGGVSGVYTGQSGPTAHFAGPGLPGPVTAAP